MTVIAHISGTERKIPPVQKAVNFQSLTKDFAGEIAEAKKIAEQKKREIPKGEFIAFSQMTEGEAKVRILKRQLEILKVTQPENCKVYELALDMVKTALHNSGHPFHHCNKITGIVENELQGIAQQIATAIEMRQPALQFGRKAANIGTINQLPINYFFDTQLRFYLGKNTVYERKYNVNLPNESFNMGTAFATLLQSMASEQATDIQGNPLTTTVTMPLTGQQFTVPIPKLSVLDVSGGSVNPNDLTYYNIANSYFNSPIAFNQDHQAEFVDRLKAASGIFDQYLGTVFAESGEIGNGFIYAFAQDATNNQGQPISIGNYPAAVGAKYGIHQLWLQRCSSFSGLSMGNVKMLGVNTIIANNGGRQPTEMLGQLMQGYNPAIGIEPATIAIIIGLITTALQVASQFMGKAKTDGTAIDPTGIPSDWQPIGAALQFEELDWTTAPTNQPPTTNQQTTTGGLGGNLLPLGLAAAGAFLLLGGKGKEKQ